ncbi:RNA-directed DNA polymerase, eukaryota [Tanacetum coccineum]
MKILDDKPGHNHGGYPLEKSNLVVLPFDLTSDEDPTDEDGGTGMGDSTGVSMSLGDEISLGGKKSQKSNIGGGEIDSEDKRSLVKSSKESGEMFPGVTGEIACPRGKNKGLGDSRLGFFGFTSALETLIDFLDQLRMPFDREKEDGRWYAFTWSHPSASKMSKLDRFLVSEGILSHFLSITAICLDRHLSDHRPILLREVHTDFGPIPFRFYHSWFSLDGFDDMVEHAWNSFSHSDANGMIRFKKKLQDLKIIIRRWVKDKKLQMSGVRSFIKNELGVIDKDLNRGVVSDTNLHRRLEINKKRSHLSIRGVFVDGLWNTKPGKVKDAFLKHFEASEVCRRDEIRMAVWNCGIIESPGPIVEYFFDKGSFPKGCNSSFIALIPKVTDAKFITDFRPISLIGCIYKVVTKILANRLALVISDLISDTQSAFVANRQILDGPFILNEVLNWCKRKKKQAMFFKVNFAKAYDSLSKASVMYIRSPSTELPFHCGLKQGDSLSPYLFILIMESLHMSFSRAVNKGLFKGEWSDANLKSIVNILKCFFLTSGLKINIYKSQVLGVGIPRSLVVQAAASIGCAVMQSQFRYLGVIVGECMSRHKAWTDTVLKLRSRLSNWKVKTLSIGGRLTLLKSVLVSSPLYNMSIYKVPRGVLKSMEAIRSKFFNGADYSDKKITWAAWDKVLASKKNGGLGVSSFHALNRALLLKWEWHFISQDGSLWFRVIQVLYGPSIDWHPVNLSSNWCSIVHELNLLKDKRSLLDRFPRLFALEMEKAVSVAVKMGTSVADSFCRFVRDGSERHQMLDLISMLESVSLSSAQDRWICDLSEDGEFRVKEVRNILDDLFLPSQLESTRWVKYIPIKINVFAWRARRDCLPTRSNLISSGWHRLSAKICECGFGLAGFVVFFGLALLVFVYPPPDQRGEGDEKEFVVIGVDTYLMEEKVVMVEDYDFVSKERLAGVNGNRVKVADKEET